jgi:hypothetical protein
MKERSAVLIALLIILALVGVEIGAIYQLHNEPRRGARSLEPQPAQTMDEAAVQVFTYIYAHSHWYEYAGLLLRWPDGSYMASVPQTLEHGTDSEEDAEPGDYPGVTIVAGYHTHPCIRDALTSVFSPEDIAGVRHFKLPEYMADFCTGDIHFLAPGDPTDKPVFGVEGEVATGKIIGHIKVDGKVIQ